MEKYGKTKNMISTVTPFSLLHPHLPELLFVLLAPHTKITNTKYEINTQYTIGYTTFIL